MSPVARFREFGLAYGERVLLADVTLDVPSLGVLNLMGPAGSGKSTLVRTLAGMTALHPAVSTWGEATYQGRPLGEGERPLLVGQNTRLVTATVLENLVSGLPNRGSLTPGDQRAWAAEILEAGGLEALADRLDAGVAELPIGLQRRLAVLRSAALSPGLLCVDEPTAALTDGEAADVLKLLERESERRAVLVVTHNQEHARRLGGRTALLAGGRIVEVGPTSDFFEHPASPTAEQFCRTGGCSLPSPSTQPEELEPDVVPSPRPAVPPPRPSSGGPRGFTWLRVGRIGGTQLPGLMNELDEDLAGLKRVGATVLVSLTVEFEPVPDAKLAAFGMRGHHLPIRDMDVPSVDEALDLCRRISDWLRRGEVVALHCKAGLGRTGTLLAAWLISEGSSAVAALSDVRAGEPRWVQSNRQVRFLEELAAAVADASRTRVGPPPPPAWEPAPNAPAPVPRRP